MLGRNWVLPSMNASKNVASVPMKPVTFKPVRVRALRPFYGLRRLIEAGEVVFLAEPDAVDAVALGRSELV